MEESNKVRSSEEEKHAQSMDRRKLLKMMATTTGAAGASFLLPAKWTKPLFDVIVLPAHAATSAENNPIVSRFTIDFPRITDKSNPLDCTSRATHNGQIECVDPQCDMNEDNTKLNYQVQPGGNIEFKNCLTESGQKISDIWSSINSNISDCEGKISFLFNATETYGKDLLVCLDVNGRPSNWVNSTIPIPYPSNETETY